jgi:purine-binding chemotaxis protein CheW
MAVAHGFCTFYLEELWFGLRVESVQEVLLAPAITPVPLAPHAIAGLVNLRGQIVTAIDLRKRLGLAERPPLAPPALLVSRHRDALLGLLVTRMDEVVEALEGGLEITPLRELVAAVYKFPGRLLQVLDLDKVVGEGKEAPYETAVK